MSVPSTPAEYAAILDDFYTFLTKLHLPASAIKRPPAGGWPGFTDEVCNTSNKTAFTMEVLKYLPYLEGCGDEGKHVHFRCHAVDYSTLSIPFIGQDPLMLAQLGGWAFGPTAMSSTVYIATACHIDGRELFLNTDTGTVNEYSTTDGPSGFVPFGDFFAKLKAKYEKLALFPIPGTETVFDAQKIHDPKYEVARPEMQPGAVFPSDQDVSVKNISCRLLFPQGIILECTSCFERKRNTFSRL
ncbi:hypothetical protein GGR53DRAFT_492608 [Hypoxylon sp. FL1150]|nr:hypothetical protein GGR53DRAFT_492608 [Hypoxylon sp. FL1150]